MGATGAWTTGGCRRLGAAGSVAVALGGWAVGTLPAHDPWGLWVPHGTAVTAAGYALAYGGLTVLVVAWWLYGRTGASVRDTLVTLAWWTAPLVLAPPLYSADVYSYIAQGAMVLEGHDVYSVGPSVLDPGGPGGDAAASVGGHWTDTPAPYGPFFLVLARGVAWATGGTIVPAVLGMRLIALAALVLIVWALRGRWITGSAAIGLAMMVKSPAAVALLFVGVVVGRAASGPVVRRVAKGLLAPGLVAGAVVVGVTFLGGTGFGWLGTQGVAGRIHTALSISSDLGLGLGELLRLLAGTDPDPVKSAVQNLGLLVALVLIARLAWHATTGRTEPVHALGVALLVLVALSPMVQPWYLLWATAVLAATASGGRALGAVTVLSASLVYETQPSGSTPPYGFVLAALASAGRRRDRAERERGSVPGQRRPADAPLGADAPTAR